MELTRTHGLTTMARRILRQRGDSSEALYANGSAVSFWPWRSTRDERRAKQDILGASVG